MIKKINRDSAFICIFLFLYLIPITLFSQSLTLRGDTLRTVLIGSELKVFGTNFTAFDTVKLQIVEVITGDYPGVDTTIFVEPDSTFETSFLIESSKFAGKEGLYRVEEGNVGPQSMNKKRILKTGDIYEDYYFLVLNGELNEIVCGVLVINDDAGQTSTNNVPLILWAGYVEPGGAIWFARSGYISNEVTDLSEDPPAGAGHTTVHMEVDILTMCWTLEDKGTDMREVFAKYWVYGAFPSEYSVIREDDISFVPDPLEEGPIFVDIKAFLQGPYDTASQTMRTDLLTGNYLPSDQPYDDLPWDYSGSESVSLFPEDVVDWIFVELRRDDPLGTSIDEQRCAGFIKNNGHIVDMDGSSPLSFNQPIGDYYIVVRHRNHLAIMSAVPISLRNATTACWDFTTGQSQAYGIDAMIDLGSDIYGMISGDTNNSGIVTNADKTLIINNMNNVGYHNADTNISGIITNADKTPIINNLNRYTQVPE